MFTSYISLIEKYHIRIEWKAGRPSASVLQELDYGNFKKYTTIEAYGKTVKEAVRKVVIELEEALKEANHWKKIHTNVKRNT